MAKISPEQAREELLLYHIPHPKPKHSPRLNWLVWCLPAPEVWGALSGSSWVHGLDTIRIPAGEERNFLTFIPILSALWREWGWGLWPREILKHSQWNFRGSCSICSNSPLVPWLPQEPQGLAYFVLMIFKRCFKKILPSMLGHVAELGCSFIAFRRIVSIFTDFKVSRTHFHRSQTGLWWSSFYRCGKVKHSEGLW